MWSFTYSGPSWHQLSGTAFACRGGSGESLIVGRTYTEDPLELTLDEWHACDRDESSFDGTTRSPRRFGLD